MSLLWPGVLDSIDGAEIPSFSTHVQSQSTLRVLCIGGFPPGKNAAGTWSWPQPAYSTEVKNSRIHASTVPYAFKVWWSINHRESFIFLGAFAKVWKTILTASYLSVCPSVYMEKLGSHWVDFRNTVFEYFSKNCWEYSIFFKI
jgi:hypothetical protein